MGFWMNSFHELADRNGNRHVGVLVLVETTLPSRLFLAAVMFGVTWVAPLKLGLGVQDLLLSMLHIVIVMLMGWVAAWQGACTAS